MVAMLQPIILVVIILALVVARYLVQPVH
jgi:hypothetical protein